MPEPAPPTKLPPPAPLSLNEIVEAFEVACNRDPSVDAAKFFPEPAHPQYTEIAIELLAVELERRWQRGDRPTLESYRQRFPRLLARGPDLERLAFEHYRLLKSHGHSAHPEDFAARFHINTAHWPHPDSTHVDAATAVLDSARTAVGDDLAADWRGPEVGERFLEFEIVERLGVGKFGRVYKARQSRLAGRPVVLKITARRWSEADRLAQLQHTHIVPIHSAHRHGDLHVVCMPYFGRHTLAQLLEGLGPRDQVTAAKFLERIVPDQSDTAEAASSAAARTRWELSRLTFEQLALTLAAEITSGLAHAHARGMLHRDLKPANILLTDDAQPMILDFNLAQNVRHQPAAQLIGGTLPYMAPEHLLATYGRGQVDARSDVYAVGVILFEMLTGQLPFGADSSADADAMEAMVERRWRERPSVRSLNSQASPAVDSIVRRCLAPDPRERYQSADELLEDLERQRRNLPLKYAPDRSWRERCGKWMQRHPRLASAGGLSVIASAIVLLLTAVIVWRGHNMERLLAHAQFQAFQSLRRQAVLPLSLPRKNSSPSEHDLAAARKALAVYSPDRVGWESKPVYRWLSEADRHQVRSWMSELLFLMASAQRRAAGDGTAERDQRLAEARQSNQLAQQLGDRDWRGPLLQQQADLEEARGRPDVAARLRQMARAHPLRHESAEFLIAQQDVLAGRFDEALPMVQRYARRHPEDLLPWFLLGHSHLALNEPLDAETYFTYCIANWPDVREAYVPRGLARCQQGRWEQAEADFTQALKLDPCHIEALFNRALARQQQGLHQQAIDDYTKLIEVGRDDSLIFLLRCDAYAQLGKRDEAMRDLREGLLREPLDVDGWIKRGTRRFETGDAEGALSDIDTALALEPRSIRALHNRAIILANAFERPEEAMQSLDRLIKLRPDDTKAHVMRGLLRARQGDRDGAREDARRALRAQPEGLTFYQAAMILATASAATADRELAEQYAADAVHYLRVALDLHPGLAEDAGEEPELATLADRADFRALLENVAVSQPAE